MCWCNYWNQMYSSRSVVTIHILLRVPISGAMVPSSSAAHLKLGLCFTAAQALPSSFLDMVCAKYHCGLQKKKGKKTKV